MRFPTELTSGILLQRYKRFLADVTLETGEEITAHCPNTGSMMGCMAPGSRVWLSRSDSTARKYPWTWELVETDGALVGINTSRTNRIVAEALEARKIPEFADYTGIRREVSVPGNRRSRLDFLLTGSGMPDYFLEVKNVTAAVSSGIALFPDAVSERATRHVQELMEIMAEGYRCGMLFCVQREDVSLVQPADEIDPAYGAALRKAARAGVDVMAWRARVNTSEVVLDCRLQVAFP